jgi:enoyl-CoA hydratase/carnithine racemase
MAELKRFEFSALQLDHRDDGRLALLTLNRPKARNAINRGMAGDLREACEALASMESGAVRAVILTGAGEAFSAGADLVERRGLQPDGRSEHTAEIEAAAEALANLPIPTVAAVHGFALGGGAELALACDLRVAGTDAVFGFPEVRIGVFPGAGGVRRLPPLVGVGAARDLLYTGRRIHAEEAARIGLVDRVVGPEMVVEASLVLARQIAENAPLAVRAVKRALHVVEEAGQGATREWVNELRRSLDRTADCEEGLAAFAEKRTPRFTGR